MSAGKYKGAPQPRGQSVGECVLDLLLLCYVHSRPPSCVDLLVKPFYVVLDSVLVLLALLFLITGAPSEFLAGLALCKLSQNGMVSDDGLEVDRRVPGEDPGESDHTVCVVGALIDQSASFLRNVLAHDATLDLMQSAARRGHQSRCK
jgi:hypothetical protein